MLKRCVFAIILITAMAAVTQAQAPQMPFSIYAGGLLSVPSSPDQFKDTYKNGWHGFVGLGFKLLPAVQAVGKVEYHSLPYDFHGVGPDIEGIEPSGGSMRIGLYGVDLVATPNIPVLPFALMCSAEPDSRTSRSAPSDNFIITPRRPITRASSTTTSAAASR